MAKVSLNLAIIDNYANKSNKIDRMMSLDIAIVLWWSSCGCVEVHSTQLVLLLPLYNTYTDDVFCDSRVISWCNPFEGDHRDHEDRDRRWGFQHQHKRRCLIEKWANQAIGTFWCLFDQHDGQGKINEKKKKTVKTSQKNCHFFERSIFANAEISLLRN